MSGGQATITGLAGNDPFRQLTFRLEDRSTFTKAILNPNATADRHVTFAVSYLDAFGSPFTATFDLDRAGQNYFGIFTEAGARITQADFSSDDTFFDNAKLKRTRSLSS